MYDVKMLDFLQNLHITKHFFSFIMQNLYPVRTHVF